MSDFDDDELVQDEYESDFIDDDDDDNDDDDYTGKKSNKRKNAKNTKSKKKQKRPRLTGRDFIQAEAEEDSQEDEYSDEEMPESERKLLEQQRKMYTEQIKRRSQGPGFLNMEGEELDEYWKNAEAREEAEDNELALLPTPQDPKIFAVKCKPKEERDACNQIMKKYFECLGTAAEFQIFSATAIDKTEGYIYIEAYSDKHVYMATANIGNIFANQVKFIHIADRPQIFETDPTKGVKVKVGQWVRIAKGLYQDDLAQVEEVDDVKEKVLVKLVPRLTPPNEDDDQNDEDDKKDRYSHLRKNKTAGGLKPPQKLFSESEYPGAQNSRDVEKGISYLLYKNNRYYDGLLYKWFPAKHLKTQNIQVTYEESKFFTIGENTDPTVLNTLIDQASNKATKFFKGDKIRVIRGDLENLEAEILKISPGSLTVKPVNTEFMEAVDISPNDCVKSFVKGDYVRVVEGKNAGKEGFILSVEDNIASIMSDGLQNMIQVFVNDLVFCNESTRNIEVKAKEKDGDPEFVKFDLIKLNDRKTVGIVLGTSNTGWRILDNFGVVRNITTYQVEQKLNTRNNLTRNDKNQTFRIADSVRILQGKYKGQTGIIKHIYSDLLFIYNPDVNANMGIIIEKANNAYLLSSQKAFNGKPSGPKGKDDLIGKKCAIKSGPWKGYQGIIKEGNERTVRMELTSKCQIIDVKRELVIEVEKIGKSTAAGPTEGRTMEPKTPMINRFPQSPMFGMNSPGFESSPAWNGFESPAYDSHIS